MKEKDKREMTQQHKQNIADSKKRYHEKQKEVNKLLSQIFEIIKQ